MNKKELKDNIAAVAIGLITTVVLLEIIFRTVLPAAQLPESTYDATYHIPKFVPGEGHYTIGKFCEKAGQWHINDQGWNSPYNYITDNRKKIAIIGDSYIEAFQVDVEKSVGPVVQSFAPEQFQVMSFGTSGAPLSQYLQLSRYVTQVFKPEILVLNLVHNDFDESVADKHLRKTYLRYLKINDSLFVEDSIEKSPKASLLSRVLNSTATGRYLLHNLKIHKMDITSLFKSKPLTDTTSFNANVDVKKIHTQQQAIRKVTELILLQFKKEFPSVRLILMIDGLRKEIYDNMPPGESNIVWMNTMVKELAIQQHIEFIDLTEAFAADYQKNKKAFEFSYDWHWNEHGHRIAAEALYQQLLLKQTNHVRHHRIL